MRLQTIHQVLKHKQCMGCGLCSLCAGISMVPQKGCVIPSAEPSDSNIEVSCPSKGYDMKNEGYELFGDVNYRYEIGYYRRLRLAHSNNLDVLENAASGGVMTQIALFLLDEELVDGVITNRFTYNGNVVRTETYIAENKEEVFKGQGSKYCPTSTLEILSSLNQEKKYLLIGTPCQIAGFRLYAKIRPELNNVIPYTIANFCGGYRDFRELDFFVQQVAHIDEVTSFRHRGGGQPGSMRIEGSKGELFQYPYPTYAHLSHSVKNERCTLCMDATGELADFSCGDAWLENRDTTAPWSIIVARSSNAEKILDQIETSQMMSFKQDITEEELIYSQKNNLTSKKYRQYKRIKVRDLLGLYSPEWHDEFPVKSGSLLKEFKIILSKMKANLLK